MIKLLPKQARYQATLRPDGPTIISAVEILLASQNPGKLAEMRRLVAGLGFEIVGPKDVGIHDAPEETGATFLDNAREKARHYARLSGRTAIADDSGLSVDALGGE